MDRRLDYIDTAKGIGIIMVVINHHLLGAEFVNSWISSFHMPLFFMITGYLYGFRNDFSKPNRTFLIQKMKGLLFPYFTLSLVVIIWNVLFYHVLFPSLTPENTVLETFLLTVSTYGYHALWFVPCLFYSSVIFFLLRKYRIHHLILILLAAFLVVFSIIPQAAVFSFYPIRFFVRIIIGLIFIYLGYLSFGLLSKMSRIGEVALLLITGLVFVLSLAGYYLFPDIFPLINIGVCRISAPVLYLFLALSNVTFILLLSKFISNPVLNFFGRNSIIIMAFHMDVTIEVAWLLEGRIPWRFGAPVESAIVILIELAMLAVMIAVINKWIPFLYQYKKLPFLKQSK